MNHNRVILFIFCFIMLFSSCSGAAVPPRETNYMKRTEPSSSQETTAETAGQDAEDEFLSKERGVDFVLHTAHTSQALSDTQFYVSGRALIRTWEEFTSFVERLKADHYFFYDIREELKDFVDTSEMVSFKTMAEFYHESFFETKSLLIVRAFGKGNGAAADVKKIIRKPVIKNSGETEYWYVVYDKERTKSERTGDYHFLFLEVDAKEAKNVHSIDAMEKAQYAQWKKARGGRLLSEPENEPIANELHFDFHIKTACVGVIDDPGMYPNATIVRSVEELLHPFEEIEKIEKTEKLKMYDFDYQYGKFPSCRQLLKQYDESFFETRFLIAAQIKGSKDRMPEIQRVVLRHLESEICYVNNTPPEDQLFVLYDPQVKFGEEGSVEMLYYIFIEIDQNPAFENIFSELYHWPAVCRVTGCDDWS